MAIRVKLDYLLLDRRLTLTDLADRIGITIANLSVLKTNKARAIRFSTLEALCRELRCQPGDLLEWTPEKPEGEGQLAPEVTHVASGTPHSRLELGRACCYSRLPDLLPLIARGRLARGCAVIGSPGR